MRRTKLDEISVRWIDSETGEDFTDRMNDSSIPPGEGIFKVARALGKLVAAQQVEAERQLLKALATVLYAEPNHSLQPRNPQPGDELVLEGVTYKYDGSTGDGDHFTRLKGENWGEAVVSLRRGSGRGRLDAEAPQPKQ